MSPVPPDIYDAGTINFDVIFYLLLDIHILNNSAVRISEHNDRTRELCLMQEFRVPYVLDLIIVHSKIVICAACYSLLKEVFTSPGKCRRAHKSKCMEVIICIFLR